MEIGVEPEKVACKDSDGNLPYCGHERTPCFRALAEVHKLRHVDAYRTGLQPFSSQDEPFDGHAADDDVCTG